MTEVGRRGVEWALRGVALALLVWSLVLLSGAGPAERLEVATSETLGEALERWTTIVAPARAHVALDHPPSRLEQEWLAALGAAGTRVEWSGPELLPSAVALEPRADPAGGADLAVSAPPGSLIVLRDTLGVLDTLRAGEHGTRAYLPRPRATVDAVVGPVVASAALRDSLSLKRLLVIGAAGWETKFTTAALEERGWQVDAEIAVSPETTVRQGASGTRRGLAAIDTARYSAVLVLDTTAAPYAERIARYVRSGGGLVLWSPAATVRGLAPLAPGRPGERIDGEGRPPRPPAPRHDLTLVPVVSLGPEALALERRDEEVALAARRVGAGRVVQHGYVDAWRWRMAGEEDEAPEAHRGWLAGLVAQVAYTGRSPLEAPPTDPAPLAALIDRLGPAVAAVDAEPTRGHQPRLPWIFAALSAALLLEWLSRRTRGAR